MSDFPSHLDRNPRPAPPRRPRRPGKGVITAGLGVALVLGIVGGFAMKPRLNDQAFGKKTENHRVVPIPREPSGLGIVVDRTVTAMTQPEPLPVTPVEPQPPPAVPDPAVAAEPKGPVVVGSIPERTPPAPGGSRPSFNCAYARTQAERLVCVDPQLAAADRRMARAYRQALDAGVPERILRRQQDAWLAAREEAARQGPEAVFDVYSERTAELQGMARY
jgi:uncharacterized protein YecT (DUF1311 family)